MEDCYTCFLLGWECPTPEECEHGGNSEQLEIDFG
jgi:hypothetical protein